MKGFIEVTSITRTKMLINVNNINFIIKAPDATEIVLNNNASSIMCKETYEEVKAMIEKAVE